MNDIVNLLAAFIGLQFDQTEAGHCFGHRAKDFDRFWHIAGQVSSWVAD
jgi:hypothetical protein